MKRDCPEKTQTQTQAQSSFNRGQRREIICFNCDKKGYMAWDCRGPKKKKGHDNLMKKEKIMKIVQEMMVKCNNKPGVFL